LPINGSIYCTLAHHTLYSYLLLNYILIQSSHSHGMGSLNRMKDRRLLSYGLMPKFLRCSLFDDGRTPHSKTHSRLLLRLCASELFCRSSCILGELHPFLVTLTLIRMIGHRHYELSSTFQVGLLGEYSLRPYLLDCIFYSHFGITTVSERHIVRGPCVDACSVLFNG